jgi:hypothetical protein
MFSSHVLFYFFPLSAGAYTTLGTGDSTDFDAFPDTAAQPEEEFADFSSAFAQNNSSSNKSGLPVAVPATAATPDLFGDFGAATNVPAAVGSANGGDLDLFGLLPSPVAAPPPPTVHFPSAGPAAVSSLDLLGGLDLVGGPVPSFAAANMSAPSSLPPLQPATILPAGKDIYGSRGLIDDQKLKKKTMTAKKMFWIKNYNLPITRPPERTSKLRKKPSAFKNFSIFVGYFCPPGSGFNPNLDPKHCYEVAENNIFPFAGPASAGPASLSAATPVSVGTTWQDLGNICSNNYVCTDTIPHHWITDSDPVPTLFFSGFQDFFALLLTVGTFTSVI